MSALAGMALGMAGVRERVVRRKIRGESGESGRCIVVAMWNVEGGG